MEPEMNGTKWTGDKNKTPKAPKWTPQETFVLIKAKNIAEEIGREGWRSNSIFGSEKKERKWNFISSYCIQQGVKRWPDQCNKRWNYIVGNFKKIKTWESQVQMGCESYWVMERSLREQMKLPGSFDREIYDVLDIKPSKADVDEMVEDDDVGDGLFPEFEPAAQKMNPGEENPADGNNRQSSPQFWIKSVFKEGSKRRSQSSSSNCQNSDVDGRMIIALERNTTLLDEQLEAQQMNSQLEREQQKELHESLIKALAKVTDDVEKIANGKP